MATCPPVPSGPLSGAVPSQRAIASLRLVLCSLVKIRLMWFFTVFSLMKQVAAICWLLMPDAISSMTSTSRELSPYAGALGCLAALIAPTEDCATTGCICERL